MARRGIGLAASYQATSLGVCVPLVTSASGPHQTASFARLSASIVLGVTVDTRHLAIDSRLRRVGPRHTVSVAHDVEVRPRADLGMTGAYARRSAEVSRREAGLA